MRDVKRSREALDPWHEWLGRFVPFLRLRRIHAVSSPTMASADWTILPATGSYGMQKEGLVRI